MEEIICYTARLPEGEEQNVTFMELLLDERWADGTIECPQACYGKTGEFNHKLAAKQTYEFLLRAVQNYPLRSVGISSAQTEEDRLLHLCCGKVSKRASFCRVF